MAIETLWDLKRIFGSWRSTRMTAAHGDPSIMVDGTQIDINMLGAPMPCALYLDPVAGDTVQAWYSAYSDKSRMVTIATVTAYYESVQFTGSVAWIRVQRTAGTGTTSNAVIR